MGLDFFASSVTDIRMLSKINPIENPSSMAGALAPCLRMSGSALHFQPCILLLVTLYSCPGSEGQIVLKVTMQTLPTPHAGCDGWDSMPRIPSSI